MNRREFIYTQGVLAASAALGSTRAFGAKASEKTAGELLSGIQCNPIDFLDEGMERCLDFMQENGAVNALFCYSQTYHLGTAPLNILARDHPVLPKDPAGRSLPYQWMKLPEGAFSDLVLQHEPLRPDAEFSGRDVFAELAEPCRERGIKVYARILEAGMRRAERIPGYTRVATVDIDGDRGHGPCWNHPDYREWIKRTAVEMMKAYPLDGLQYGAERVGALSEILFKGQKASCFCEHCRRRNEALGIDLTAVRKGMGELSALMEGMAGGGERPIDGVMTATLRTFLEYPDMLAFYREWLQADAEIQRMVYDATKSIRPEADVGQHIDHQRSSWDLFYRAAVSYEQMADYNDYIKPILYHEILGPRMKEWVIDEMKKRVLGDFSHDLALEVFYALFGLDSSLEPAYDELYSDGLSPEYVYRETRRCVRGAAGKARVYAGIGIDVPHYIPGGMKPVISDPRSVSEATRRAVEAGAAGVVASREYREMTRPSLRAFGDAVREMASEGGREV